MNDKPIKVSIFFIFFMVLYELIVNLSNDMYLPAVPAIKQFFHADFSYMQLTLTMWFAGSIIMNPVLGVLADARGKRKILLWSGVIFSLATIYCTFTTAAYLFLVARFLQGLTVTSIVICGYALIHEMYNAKQTIMIIAWMSSALITAPMLGPLVGGYVVYQLNWRFVFFLLACGAIFALTGLYFLMPTTRSDLVNSSINVKKELSNYKRIICNTEFLLPCLMAGATYGGFIAWITISPFLIMIQNHYSSLAFGFLQLPVFGSYIFGTIMLSLGIKLSLLSENRIVMIGILILIFVAAGFSTLAFTGNLNFILLLIGLGIYSFAVGFMSSTLNHMVAKAGDFGMGKIMAMYDFMLGITATVTTFMLSVNSANLISYMGWVLSAFSLFTVLCYFLQQFKKSPVHAKSIN
jgi:predicted MFS family arabinose efflux permease